MVDSTSTYQYTPTTDEEKWIVDQYGKTREAQKVKTDADYTISRRGYENQLGQSDATYQPLRDEAYVNTALAEKTRKENMANMGMSGEGGTSLSLQQRNTGNLLSTLGNISREQQGYEDQINLALANLDTTYSASLASIDADADAQQIAALLAQKQFDKNYVLSERDVNETERYNQLNQYIELYNAKRISKKELNDAKARLLDNYVGGN